MVSQNRPCLEVNDTRSDDVDAALPPGTRRQAKSHLQPCEASAIAPTELRRTLAHLSDLLRLPAPRTIKLAVLRHLHDRHGMAGTTNDSVGSAPGDATDLAS